MTDAKPSEILDIFNLAGRAAIVTGAGRGIGHEIARLLAAAGADVLVADIDPATAEASARSIGARSCVVDVAEEASVIGMFCQAVETNGRVDIVVNNAGIFPKYRFTELTVEAWDRMQAVNLRGVFLCMREAVKAMRRDGLGGSIVNVSSVSSLRAAVLSNQAYGASKAGVNNLTRSCALEFAPDRIRVNAVLPGGVATEGARAATGSFPVTGPLTSPERRPLGRYASPADIARAVLFFASPASDYVTGQVLAVDGGFEVS